MLRQSLKIIRSRNVQARTITGYNSTGGAPSAGDEGTRILVTGASGQIGLELVPFLRHKFSPNNVIASDVRAPPRHTLEDGPFIYTDVLQHDQLARVVLEHRIDWIVHLATMLSAIGERNPQLALKVNTRGIESILELSRMNNIRIFAPSTIAVFGETTPRTMTPNSTIQEPVTIYGLTKVYMEHLGRYYNRRYGVDFRSVRYPGVISSESLPGGGTTDYAVDIYYAALRKRRYKCFLKPDTALPMMYMPDCVRGTFELLTADANRLSKRVYNMTSMSFTPEQLAASIRKFIPDFVMEYEESDFRQAIAQTWPESLDDSLARKDWDWAPQYCIQTMTLDMLTRLRRRMIDAGEQIPELEGI
eukprot:Rmarinus@m.3609